MRTTRIYLNQTLVLNDSIKIEGQAFQHLIKVLRFKVGQNFIAFNGDGFNYNLSIQETSKKSLNCNVIEQQKAPTLSPLKITLYQAISKSEHMDFSIQKSTELGVHKIIPFYSERSQNRFKQKQQEKKQQHWQKIIQSASEQCGRADLTSLEPIANFNEILTKLKDVKHKAVLHFNKAAIHFSNLEKDITEIAIICGAEGGFTANEIIQLQNIKTQILTLGPRILRTETAAITALSILQNLYGDL